MWFCNGSSSLVTECERAHIDEAQSIKNTEIATELALPPVKIHCSVLAEDAVKSAINDYKESAVVMISGSFCSNCGHDSHCGTRYAAI